MYISLHNRSCYSFGSALSRPEDLIAFARHYGMPAVALTDLDGMYGAIHFYQACKKAGVKPIIGAEVSLRDGQHVTLLARGLVGYGNICKVVSLRRLREEPLRVEDLGEYANDVICLIGKARGGKGTRGRGGEGARGRADDAAAIRRFALRGRGDRRRDWASIQLLRETFGTDLYIELAIHDQEDTVRARRLAGLADELGIPVVASCESRCMDREDGLLLRALQSIGTLTLLDQPHAEKPAGTWHFRTPQEMDKLFARRPDALRNTFVIAEQCGFEIDLDRNRFPAWSPESHGSAGINPAARKNAKTAMEHLRELCIAGCKWRYVDTLPQKGMGGKRPTLSEALARLERELAIIEQVHYAEYFLVFHEIVEYCRSQGIATLARGSAADSLVCFALGVSHACPFRFDLPFDRFLNPERAKFSKMADIDLDLPWDQRDQVIRWVFDRWGHDRVAMIGLANTYHARAAVAELGKIFGLPAHEVHKATKLLPHTAAFNIERAISRSPEAKEFPIHEEPYRTILQFACSLEGIPHHWAMHPCGAVVAPEPLAELVPVQRSPKGYLISQYDMDAIEAMGFIKIDLLGQAGLSVLRDTVEEIRTTDHREIDLHNDIDYADPATWNMIATGGARGVHHIESPAMTSLLRQCNCRDIDCLTAIVAIIRPGAANQGKKEVYARRHQGFEPPHYVHPSLVPVLEKTYGLMVFEEHILQIATEFAGMNLGRADVLRRALNKENHKLIAEMKSEFWQCARNVGRGEEEIAAVWGQVEGFTGFMFNKAHSAEYAVEAFQGAWLKYRWPAHYLAAILSNYRGFYSHSPTLPQILYVLEALRLGIGFLPPCVNRSGRRFRVELETRRLGDAARERGGEWVRGRGGEERMQPPFGGLFCGDAETRGEAVRGIGGSSTGFSHKRDTNTAFQRAEAGETPAPHGALADKPPVAPCEAGFAGRDSRGRWFEKGFSNQHSGFPNQRSEWEVAQDSMESHFAGRMIRVPIMHIKGIAQEFVTRYLEEREKGLFEDLADFLERCRPGEAEAIALLDSGALDCFGLPRPFAFWQIRRYLHTGGRSEGASLYGEQMTRRHPPRRVNSDAETRRREQCSVSEGSAGLNPAARGGDEQLPPVELTVPDVRQIARREMELLGFPITIDPLTFLGEEDDGSQIDWSAYVPVNELDRYCGRRVRVCGIMIADRINLTTEGDLMKFVSLADRTGVVETFLFPDTYRRFGHLTVSNPILAATGLVEPFENRNGISLRVEHVTLPRRVGTHSSSE